MKKVFIIFFLTSWVLLGFFSEALCARGGRSWRGGYHGWSHHHHGRGSNVYFSFGFPFYQYPYSYYPFGYFPYRYPYYYPYSYPAYPYAYPDYTYQDERTQVFSEPEQPYYWYFCRDPEGYYPYVASCPTGWTKVIPTPPGEESGTK